MRWILIDLALVVVPLAVVVVLGLGLWRRVKRLMATGAKLMALQEQASALSVGPGRSTPPRASSSPRVDTGRSPSRRR